MKWAISIFTADGKRLIFAAQSSREEVRELAGEARRQGARLQIFLRSPQGEVTTWPCLTRATQRWIADIFPARGGSQSMPAEILADLPEPPWNEPQADPDLVAWLLLHTRR